MKTPRRAIALLCVILIFAYACAYLLPHCHDSDCAVCMITEALRSLLLVLALSDIVFRLTDCACMAHPPRQFYAIRGATPVGLKVKLSN